MLNVINVQTNPTFEAMSEDEKFMERCFELALLGAGSVAPNPMVGCVIVHDGKIIGEGFHQHFGEAHAEVNAIASVSDHSMLEKSTLYVNLEPCAHHGKTPPCSDFIIEKKIKRVIVSNEDPFEKVGGRGIMRLRDAGIDVTTGVLEHQGRELNRRFFTFHEQKRPYVILKFAQTNDGYLDADRSDESDDAPLKISAFETDRLVHKWRSEESGILVGQNTIAMDNPSLTTRLWPGKNPLRIVIDPQLQMMGDRVVLNDGGHTWIFNALRNDYCENNLCYVQLHDPENYLQEIMTYLHKCEIQSIIVEGGATTLSKFLEHALWDEARIITGPMRIGAGVSSPSISGHCVQSFRVENDLIQFYVRQ